MPRKKKGFQRASRPGNRLISSRTFRLTDIQESLIARYNILQDQTFSKFNSDLIDMYFKSKNIIDEYDRAETNSSDKINFIGNGVDIEDAAHCLFAWIDNQPLNEIKIQPHCLLFFETVADKIGEPESTEACSNFLELVKLISNIYFDDLHLHYLMFCAMQDLIISDKSYINLVRPMKSFLNNMVGFEIGRAHFIVTWSPMARFAIFFCRRYNLLSCPAHQPQWYKEAPKDVIRALDHTWKT